MSLPRCRSVSVEAASFCHVINGCVRRQFLCGFDSQTGPVFSNRRRFIQEQVFELQGISAGAVCA